MDSSKKPDEERPPEGDQPDAPTEDRAAILSRRAFLIESALASAGITLGLAGCEGTSKPATPQVCLQPQICLSVREPAVCLKVAPGTQPGAPATQPGAPATQPGAPPAPAPHPCLSVAPRTCLSVSPKVCLRVAPRRDRPDGGLPRPCLSRPRPQKCLSIKPKGRICLSEF